MNLQIGQKAEFKKTLTFEDVKMFAQITGDINPIHFDKEYAAETIFEKPIVHGILTAGLISSVIANTLPGEGSIYLGQDLRFTAPVFHGDTLTAKVEIVEIIREKHQAILKTEVINQYNVTVITGTARVKHPNI